MLRSFCDHFHSLFCKPAYSTKIDMKVKKADKKHSEQHKEKWEKKKKKERNKCTNALKYAWSEKFLSVKLEIPDENFTLL